MIPQMFRLFTWVDVKEYLLYVRDTEGWPEWLHSAQAYWDGLILEIKPGNIAAALEWLADTFEPRFEHNRQDPHESYILLESLDQLRQFEIRIDETEEAPVEPQFRPRLSRPVVLSRFRPPVAAPANFPDDLPPLIALHSFKGGVGRTLHAISLAKALAKASPEKHVILIDADLEAPGITWLLDEGKLGTALSFVDILALVHGDPEPKSGQTLRLIADRIMKSPPLDGIYIIPAFRSRKLFTSLQIKPEHLVQGSSDPFIITSTLAQLGKILDASAVIVDLRAGLSELSAGFLFDPRVYRILVTTLSAQSLEGTKKVFQVLQEFTPPNSAYPAPKVIISQIPIETFEKKERLQPDIEAIEEITQDFWQIAQYEGALQAHPHLLLMPFDSNLMVLPGSWDELMGRLQSSTIFPEVQKRIIDWIPIAQVGEEFPLINVRENREQLMAFTQSLLDVEAGRVQKFLPIAPIRNLARDFQRILPVVIIAGAEGAGKTYTFLQIIRQQWWKRFIAEVEKRETEEGIQAGCYPIIYPKNLTEKARKILNNTEESIKNSLSIKASLLEGEDISEYVIEGLKEQFNAAKWREYGLNLISMRIGFRDLERESLPYLQEQKKKVIAVIDGLEDIFEDRMLDDSVLKYYQDELKERPEQAIVTLKRQKMIALHSLLQDVPAWIEQYPGSPLGILIFVRRDLIQENLAQLKKRYAPYELQWTQEETLRLCVWIFENALYPQRLSFSELLSQLLNCKENELLRWLFPLWGRKVGPEHSNEPTSAQYVMAALSNSEGEILAREMVRFLYMAARESIEDTSWTDRLITPEILRRAAEEYFKELTRVQEIKLREISDFELYQEAVKFIQNITIEPSVIEKLEQITRDARNFSGVLEFLKKQANEKYSSPEDKVKYENRAKFYQALTQKLEDLLDSVKTNRIFIPDSPTDRQLQMYTEFYGLLFAREFIYHLIAEYHYQAGEE